MMLDSELQVAANYFAYKRTEKHRQALIVLAMTGNAVSAIKLIKDLAQTDLRTAKQVYDLHYKMHNDDRVTVNVPPEVING